MLALRHQCIKYLFIGRKLSTVTAPLILVEYGSWKDYQDAFDVKEWDESRTRVVREAVNVRISYAGLGS